MKQIFLLLSIFLLLQQNGKAQVGDGIIKGKITSPQKPIGFASFGLVETGNGGTADENGNFIIRDVLPGTYKISVSALGYNKLSKTITIANRETLVLAIKLKENKTT